MCCTSCPSSGTMLEKSVSRVIPWILLCPSIPMNKPNQTNPCPTVPTASGDLPNISPVWFHELHPSAPRLTHLHSRTVALDQESLSSIHSRGSVVQGSELTASDTNKNWNPLTPTATQRAAPCSKTKPAISNSPSYY